MITSTNNAKLKLARSLSGRAKERREAGVFLTEGVRLVEEALAGNWPFRFALYSNDLSERGLDLVRRLEEKHIELDKVNSTLLRSLSDTETPQGILAVLSDIRIAFPAAPNLVLILDSIRDPGNLGTLLRTADAAGVQAVLLPPETTDAFSPKVIRAGMGAHFHLPIHTADWNQIRRYIDSADLVATLADTKGRPCWETDLRPGQALIIGGEAEGATEPARKLAKQMVSIPMPGRVESLNAAVAGSILMFEVVRQRRLAV
jgi:TrmH family RNA methyltransferase